MLTICVRPERVRPKLSSIQGIRANLVYIVSLIKIGRPKFYADEMITAAYELGTLGACLEPAVILY